MLHIFHGLYCNVTDWNTDRTQLIILFPPKSRKTWCWHIQFHSCMAPHSWGNSSARTGNKTIEMLQCKQDLCPYWPTQSICMASQWACGTNHAQMTSEQFWVFVAEFCCWKSHPIIGSSHILASPLTDAKPEIRTRLYDRMVLEKVYPTKSKKTAFGHAPVCWTSRWLSCTPRTTQ